MTKRLRAPLVELAEGERTLDAASSRYLAGSLRLRAGDPFVAFDPDAGVEADATLLRVDGDRVLVRLGAVRPASLVATRSVTWLQGMAKGDKMDGIVRDATELGAVRIVPVLTAFGVVKLADARVKARVQRWERIAREAARQCGRGDAPAVLAPAPWREALANVDPTDARFCLHARGGQPLGPLLAESLLSARAGLAFAAGPEGGLHEDEVRVAEAAGWSVVSLGPFVLRTETVAAAVLGAVRVAETW
jgi:16S rRNA (uracil1498-N3)-methyltransferase